jgi:hypothetical protein
MKIPPPAFSKIAQSFMIRLPPLLVIPAPLLRMIEDFIANEQSIASITGTVQLFLNMQLLTVTCPPRQLNPHVALVIENPSTVTLLSVHVKHLLPTPKTELLQSMIHALSPFSDIIVSETCVMAMSLFPSPV